MMSDGAKAEREHAEAKRTLACAKSVRAEWELVNMKTQVAMERAKRQRDC
jgi:hypothetical protein